MSDLRETILAEEEVVASRRRFGLFSQPPPLAVGDDGQFKKIQHARGEDGKPITKAPQMLAGTCKTGMVKSSYFGVPESIYAKDPYKEQYKLDCQYQKQMHTRSKFHENEFKPASGVKSLAKSSYNYTEEKTAPRKPIQRDETGKVKTDPRNFTTNPISKIQKESFKHPKHMPDPYDRKKQLDKKEREIFKKKLPADTPMFKSMSHGSKLFNRDSHVYGEDDTTKRLQQSRKARSKTIANVYPHEAKFKPARRGHGDPIGRYPTFMEKQTSEMMDQIKKKIPKEEGKEKWKSNNFGLSRPTPSISLHPKNIHIGRYK